ncbi:RNA-directed DNA polymerase from mobile element jockey [Eumeta japonica]|uniref:RNA-directed DNA polymerase from mobile element jockey n=1 Tax=Eumeta variegata TaxID=151549 RepID=A0A4C1Y1I5_EUMVA|nr:RNA-directed DNA polymerase from mobile element jockey [Eumeta japonica]
MLGRKSKLSLRNKCITYEMCIRAASPVFVYAAPKTLDRLKVIQNKFSRDATNAHLCVRNSILHRDLEFPTIAKFMKDVSKRFFEIMELHPDALLCSAASCEPT